MCIAFMFCIWAVCSCVPACVQMHVFGNYWLGGFKDRDPEPIRARGTLYYIAAIPYKGARHYTTLYKGSGQGCPQA